MLKILKWNDKYFTDTMVCYYDSPICGLIVLILN
jgi:hypothetical protein